MHTVEFLNNSNISVKTQPNSKIRIMKKKKTEVELDTLPLTGNTVLICVYFTFYFTLKPVKFGSGSRQTRSDLATRLLWGTNG